MTSRASNFTSISDDSDGVASARLTFFFLSRLASGTSENEVEHEVETEDEMRRERSMGLVVGCWKLIEGEWVTAMRRQWVDLRFEVVVGTGKEDEGYLRRGEGMV